MSVYLVTGMTSLAIAAGFLLAAGTVFADDAEQTAAKPGPVVVFETDKGTFEFETYPDETPKTWRTSLGW